MFFGGQDLFLAFLKVVFLNGVRDIGWLGLDFQYGWGLVDVGVVLEMVQNQQFYFIKLSYGGECIFFLVVLEGVLVVKVMVVWYDVVGVLIVEKVLVNDFDFWVLGLEG